MAKYSQRSILSPNWVASGTSHLFYHYSAGSGYSVLFKDGQDLGAEHGSQPSSDNQWRYVEADGRLEYYISTISTLGANDLRPYIGMGYRDLLDNSGFKRSSTNHLGYDRLSEYYYIPIGAIWYLNEKVSLKSQYNYFLEGKQISFLNEVLPNTYSVNPKNIQRIGWGIDLTLRSKLNDKWSTYGFFRSWSIEDSDSTACSPLIYCMEPKNQTHEIGAGISYNF